MTHESKQAAKWIGKRCSFNSELGGPMAGKVLVGIVDAAKYIGKTERGRIPNYSLSVRGQSGKTLEVNLVEQYARISDDETNSSQ